MKSTADYIRSPYLRKRYEEALAKWEEGVERSVAHDRLESAWPSSSEGGIQGVSKLGGVAVPKANQQEKQ